MVDMFAAATVPPPPPLSGDSTLTGQEARDVTLTPLLTAQELTMRNVMRWLD
jgi:hypothetical protein